MIAAASPGIAAASHPLHSIEFDLERTGPLSTSLPLITIAAAGGIAVTLQAQFMGLMDKQIGTLESVFITYAGGGLLVGLAMLLVRGGNLAAWQTVPWYALTAGALGLVIVTPPA